MEIKLSKNWKIMSNQYNFVLWRRSEPKVDENGVKIAKNEKWIEEGFYCKMNHLINRYLEYRIRGTDVSSLRAFISMYTSLYDDINSIVSNEYENVLRRNRDLEFKNKNLRRHIDGQK